MAASEERRYKRAHDAGRNGHAMPRGLADLADSDPKIDRAYDGGSHNEPWSTTRGELGFTDEPAPTSKKKTRNGRGLLGTSRAVPRLSSQSVGRTIATATIGSIALGAVACALILSLIDYGVDGPKMWFEAKFLNEATSTSSTSSTSTSSTATTSATNRPSTVQVTPTNPQTSGIGATV